MTGCLVCPPPGNGAENRNDGGELHVSKPDHHEDRYGVKRVNRDVVPSEVIDRSDDEPKRYYHPKELKPGPPEQERSNSIHATPAL